MIINGDEMNAGISIVVPYRVLANAESQNIAIMASWRGIQIGELIVPPEGFAALVIAIRIAKEMVGSGIQVERPIFQARMYSRCLTSAGICPDRCCWSGIILAKATLFFAFLPRGKSDGRSPHCFHRG